METEGYIDIHSHILWGLDDGAKDREEMLAMMTQAYEDGARALCFTPHYEPENFDYDVDTLQLRFSEAKAYAEEHLPGLSLCFGNEMSIRTDGVECLRYGKCLTLSGGRYVLLDFFGLSDCKQMRKSLESFLCAGYLPIVAHVERYSFMQGKLREVAEMSNEGVLFQINSLSLMTERGGSSKKMAEKLLARGLADIIASDAHDQTLRTPKLSECIAYVRKKYGNDYADMLFYKNPKTVLRNQSIQL